MPTRWLSVRHRNPPHRNNDIEITKQQEFDFAFSVTPPEKRAGTSSDFEAGPRPVEIRPATSGGAISKGSSRLEVPAGRPKTSENKRPSPLKDPNGISRADDTLIGLAFGSPSHPPASFCTPPLERDPIGIASPSHMSPGRAQRMQSKRWRKLGTLFKSRHNAVQRDDVPVGPKIGLPTGLVILDQGTAEPTQVRRDIPTKPYWPERPPKDPPQPPSPPPLGNRSKHAPRVAEKSQLGGGENGISIPLATTDSGHYGELCAKPPLPKLELEIPSQPLDRYSIMFKNIPAASRSSSLLARRSKTLDSLKSFESLPSANGDQDASRAYKDTLAPPMNQQRLANSSAKSPAVSKYSLFPPTSPAPVKLLGGGTGANLPISHTQLKRSVTSPARLSPMVERFSADEPEPLSLKRQPPHYTASSPEETNTASTDRDNPWSTTHSLKSSVSSATTMEEIFFDIKSFRDSKGVEDGQFVMTRPDSAAVQLARTRSKRVQESSRLRRVQMPDQSESSPSISTPPLAPPSTGSMSSGTTKHTSVNTAYFEEAIAAVERLTSPTNAAAGERRPSADMKLPALTFRGKVEEKLQPAAPSKPVAKGPDSHHTRQNRSKEEVIRLIPSPVAEVKEDSSQVSSNSSSTVKAAPTPATHLSPRIAMTKHMDRPIDDSPTIPQGPPIARRDAKSDEDTPPPVPKKDAKFIPMSKYASKSTVSKIESAGMVPRVPVRSNTDITPTASPVRVNKDRSATVPSRWNDPHTAASASRATPDKPVAQHPSRPNPMAMNPVTEVVIAPPATEVAIARTVSLARKQSARVHVAGPKLTARRAEAAAAAAAAATAVTTATGPGGQQQSPPAATQTSVSSLAVPQSPKAAPAGSSHRHRRSNSKNLSRDRISKTQAAAKKEMEKTEKVVKEARKWEILEKKSYSPVVVQGHKMGKSVVGVLESV